MKQARGNLIKGIAGIVSVSMLLIGCEKQEEKVEIPKIAVETKQAEEGELSIEGSFIGTVSPQEAVYVVPFVSGEISKVNVALGDYVEQGTVLCQIDDEAARLQLESAQATYNTAQASANQALGGSQSLQDIQMQSGITQLEKQINSINNTIIDGNEEISDLRDKLDDTDKLVSSQKNAYQKAAQRYAVASNIAANLEGSGATNPMAAAIQILTTADNPEDGGATGKDPSDVGTTDSGTTSSDTTDENSDAEKLSENDMETADTIAEPVVKTAAVLTIGYTTDIKGAKEYLEEHKSDADYSMKAPIINTYIMMLSNGLTDADLTATGLEALKNTATLTQGAYQSAASAQASIESGITSYENAVKQAATNKESLVDNLNSAKKTQEVTNSQVKQEAQAIMDAQLNAAGIGIKSAKMQLDMYTLTAPISGNVESVGVTENGFATSGNVAFIISNKDTMTVTFAVSESVRNHFMVGQKISVDRNGSIYQGNITEINTMVDQQTGLFKIKASVQATGDELLTGTSVKITAQTDSETEGLLIPYDAVYYSNGIAYLYVAEDGKAVKKEVEVGVFNETTISVLSGITSEDKVIVSWSPNLRDGAEIEVKEVEE